MENLKLHQGDAMSSVTYLFNTLGAPSHFPMENRLEEAVVGRRPRMKKKDSEWPLPCGVFQTFAKS